MNFDPSMVVDPDVITALVAEPDNRDGLLSSFGRYTLKNLMTGRVALLPEEGDPHVLYVIDNRLIVDDYLLPEEVAELGGIWPPTT